MNISENCQLKKNLVLIQSSRKISRGTNTNFLVELNLEQIFFLEKTHHFKLFC